MSTYKVIGLMSGTSLDGLDIVYASFEKKENWHFKISCCDSIAYPEEWLNNLKKAYHWSKQKVKQLDDAYGVFLGDAVLTFLKKHNINKRSVDFIASHGHTIWHRPKEGFTLQIGNGNQIASTTGINCVCDFRSKDVALGGQGAPLVPRGDQLLFSKFQACVNLGGFSNISFDWKDQRIAFDICPVNTLLNTYANNLGKPYDYNGEWAKQGQINPALLKKLNALNYYTQPHPKSLGIEFNEQFIYPLISSEIPLKNILRTLVEHISTQIAFVFNDYNIESALFTGGGCLNTFLMKEIEKKTPTAIVIPPKKIIDFKEALIFAFLGVLHRRDEVNTLKSVTGAKEDSIGGVFYKA